MDPVERLIVVKTAPLTLLSNELKALKLCHGHASIRQLIDEVQDPPSLVLQYLDDNLWHASSLQRLNRLEIKRAAKAVLEGLILLHGLGRAHTGTQSGIGLNWFTTDQDRTVDIKPNNILANKGDGNKRFKNFQLGDMGDCVPVAVESNNGFHIIGAPMFRAPEVMLNIPWTTAVDIWSFGATVRSYNLGSML